MKKLLFISIFICSIVATSAQGVISGSVLVRDSVRVAPQGVTVVIIYSNDSPPKELHYLIIWSEDDGGAYKFEGVDYGIYKLLLSACGCEHVWQEVVLSPENRVVDMGCDTLDLTYPRPVWATKRQWKKLMRP